MTARDVVFFAGFAAFVAGLAAFDWRVAAVAAGSLAMTAGVKWPRKR